MLVYISIFSYYLFVSDFFVVAFFLKSIYEVYISIFFLIFVPICVFLVAFLIIWLFVFEYLSGFFVFVFFYTTLLLLGISVVAWCLFCHSFIFSLLVGNLKLFYLLSYNCCSAIVS